ncbi:MAG: hypothetical protein HY393_00735 [Candidatus Diapherotrites archaeon]|nr:hypothetical protein [Candidatus Diapherotrites archaeon]
MNVLKHVWALLAVLVLFAGLGSMAHAVSVEFIPQFPENVALEKASSVGLPFLVKNTHFESQCITIGVDSNSNFVTAESTLSATCLNPFESATMTLTLNTSTDAPDGNYQVKATLYHNENVTTRIVNVFVGSNPFIDLQGYSKNVCDSTLEEKLAVKILNKTSKNALFKAGAENEAFVPFVEPETFSLDPHEEKFLDAVIHYNETYLGDYEVTVRVQSDSVPLLAQKRVPFTVLACAPIQQPAFTLSNFTNLSVDKNVSSHKVFFTLKNLLNESQSVTIVPSSDLLTGTHTFTLSPNESKQAYFEVFPFPEDAAGSHAVQVHAFNEKYSTQVEIVLTLKPLSNIQISFLPAKQVIPINSTSTVYLLVENKGDFNETVQFTALSVPQGVLYAFVPSSTSIQPGKSAEVKLNLTPTPATPLGDYGFKLQAKGTSIQALEIPFTVVPEEFVVTEGVVQILSYPKEIHITPNTSKSLPVTLVNPSGETLKDAMLSLYGLPDGQDFAFKAVAPSTFAPGEIVVVPATLQAGSKIIPGTYALVLEFKTNKYKAVANVKLVVEPAGGAQAQPNPFGMLITGFATIISNTSMLLLILIVLAILAFVLARRAGGKPQLPKGIVQSAAKEPFPQKEYTSYTSFKEW